MSVKDARKALLAAMDNAPFTLPGSSEVDRAIDAFAAAVRAETLAPATCGQSAELLRDGLEWLTDQHECFPGTRVAEMAKAVDDHMLSLRASIAAADDEIAQIARWKREQQQALVHLSCVLMDCGLVKSAGDDCVEVACEAAKENAELRKLCEMAEKACVLSLAKHAYISPPERCGCDGCDAAADVVREAAARRAGK